MSINDITQQIITSAIISGSLTTVLSFYFNRRNIHFTALKTFEFQAKNRVYSTLGSSSLRCIQSSGIAYRRINLLRKRIEHKEETWINRFSKIERTVKRTAYELISPLAELKILSDRLTPLDLQLTPILRLQYDIGNIIVSSFYDDDEISSIPYKSKLLKDASPFTQTGSLKKGLSIAYVDEMRELLILESEEKSKVMTLGHFLKLLDSDTNQEHFNKFKDFFEILMCINPIEKPLFWKKLFVQEILHNTMLNLYNLEYSKSFFHTDIRKWRKSRIESCKNDFPNQIIIKLIDQNQDSFTDLDDAEVTKNNVLKYIKEKLKNNMQIS